ncbi:hypothetical protein M1585_02570 [Candidatus Parvarchaeota archaeon]|nr:hypothetical protein [Candidatus Parvarchaeota archaeon]
MVVLRISSSLLWLLVIVIIVLLAIFVFVKINKAQPTVNVNLIPSSIQYALEYFNAAYSNATILVPSQYYSAAKALSINGNRAVENNTLYNSILFGSAKLPAGYDILIDMENASSLPSLTFFPYNFTTETLSNSFRDCEVAKNKTEAFAVCSIYSNVTIPIANSTTITKSVRIGFGTFIAFPNSTYLYEINGTLSYNGQNTTYIPSIRINNTRFYNGLMFLYQNTTAFFLSKADLNTFYGREMFLPNSTLKNVVANFFSARIVS